SSAARHTWTSSLSSVRAGGAGDHGTGIADAWRSALALRHQLPQALQAFRGRFDRVALVRGILLVHQPLGLDLKRSVDSGAQVHIAGAQLGEAGRLAGVSRLPLAVLDVEVRDPVGVAADERGGVLAANRDPEDIN